jgi:seryl-tRNA synthetase
MWLEPGARNELARETGAGRASTRRSSGRRDTGEGAGEAIIRVVAYVNDPADVVANYEQESARRELNVLQKEIGTIKKAKGDASELLEKKAVIDKKIAELSAKAVDLAKQRDKKAGTIGNIVDKDSAISLTEVSTGAGTETERAGCGVESNGNGAGMVRSTVQTETRRQDDNPTLAVWHPEPNHKGNSPPGLQVEDKTTGIISHHEVLARLEAYDTDRGARRVLHGVWSMF